MGCGSSSLKGDEQAGTNDPAPQPLKKVATNFGNVDYEAAASNRRDTVYAPHDEIRHKSEALSPLTEKVSNPVNHAAPKHSSEVPAAAAPSASTTQPQTTSTEFQSLVPENPEVNSYVQRQGEGVHQSPYHDVTETPVSPVAHNHVDPPPQAPKPSTDKVIPPPTTQ